MQSFHRSPHCHSRDVHEYSCVAAALVASSSLIRSFHLPPTTTWLLLARPRFARGSIVTSKTLTWRASLTQPWTHCSIYSFDASFPLPTTSALFPWVSDIRKTVCSGWKIRPLPLTLLVSLQAMAVYRQTVVPTTTCFVGSGA